jgi:predicted membrane protein
VSHRRTAGAALAWGLALAVSALLTAREAALEHFPWHLAFGGAAGVLAGALWHRARGLVAGPTRSPLDCRTQCAYHLAAA